MACKPSKKAPRGGKPAFSAETCAFQQRRGTDGRAYVAVPNNLGQFVWTLVPEKVATKARRLVASYAPTVAHKAAHLAAQHMYRRLAPANDFYDLATATYGPQYYDYYHESTKPNRYWARY